MSTLARITQRVQASMGMLRHGAQQTQPPPPHPAAAPSGFPSARHSYQKPETEPAPPAPVQRRDPRPRPEPERPAAPDPADETTAQVDDDRSSPRDEPIEVRPPQRPSAAPLAPETRTATSRETPKREPIRATEPLIKQRKPSEDDPGVPLRSTKIVPVRPQARIVGPQQPQQSAEPPKQEMLQFDPVNRGRFEKSEPTIVDGEDLDVPTFMRHNPKATTT